LKQTLIVGFGNTFRRDDGVARVVINNLRERADRPPLPPLDDGFDDLGHPIDTVVMHQIVPELAEILADYEFVIFVDAHVATLPDPIHQEELEVGFKTPFVSHQFHPSTVLALAKQMHGEAPEAVLLSLLGHDFDFGEGLSEETHELVPEAVTRIINLIKERTTDA
jgi:hydrogenase maturation protease